jgi:hypothetical protein
MLNKISSYWQCITATLFPGAAEELPTTDLHRKVMVVLDQARIEDLIDSPILHTSRGRPPHNRTALARAFVAKAAMNITTTSALIDRLKVDSVLRRICGWEVGRQVPSEGTFSNAFAEFAEMKLGERAHERLVISSHNDVPVHHISRDSTPIEAREAPTKKPHTEVEVKPKKKRGRPKKGEVRETPPPTRLEQQKTMTFEQMMEELPTKCDVGCKKNAKGFVTSWIGYKLHIDSADGGIPISAILTSASVHDSGVSLPLEELSSRRVNSLYTIADAAYDASIIKEDIESRGKVALIDNNPRRGEKQKFDPPQAERYKQRSTAERTNSDAKDNFGFRHVRVRGAVKIMSHLMFGILALTAYRLVLLD